MCNSPGEDLKLLEHEPALRSVRVLDCVESTNSTALDWIRAEGPETPALVIARAQSGGRGQAERPWHSPPGNLMASWIVRSPHAADERASWVSGLAVAAPLAIVDLVRASAPGLRPRPLIKWPNDVLLGGRKLAGVLIETLPHDGELWAVIGIGINVNAPFPEPECDPLGLDRIATSLLRATGGTTCLARLARALTGLLLERLEQGQADRMAMVRDYQDSQWRIGRTITVQCPDRMVQGQCRGIAANGALLVRDGENLVEIVSGRIEINPA